MTVYLEKPMSEPCEPFDVYETPFGNEWLVDKSVEVMRGEEVVGVTREHIYQDLLGRLTSHPDHARQLLDKMIECLLKDEQLAQEVLGKPDVKGMNATHNFAYRRLANSNEANTECFEDYLRNIEREERQAELPDFND